MNESSPPTDDPNESILAHFVQDLEETADLEEVVRKYQAAHPHLADQFRGLAGTRRRFEDIVDGRDRGEEPPPYLGGFHLVRRIGRGGMGEVFEAVEERLRRRVAVKIVHRQRLSPMHRVRFLREQLVLAKLHQTHIVPIFAAGEEGTLQYFAMPYIEGAALHHALEVARQHDTPWPDGKTPDLSTLARMVSTSNGQGAPATTTDSGAATVPARGDSLPPRETLSLGYFRSVATVMADVADALQHAHGAGIIHRDVKPSNIMISRDEKCWIIDFGLAGYRKNRNGGSPDQEELTTGPTAVTGVMGTPQYMAPEQWTEPQEVDARADVWGLGATLYELLTLQPAFQGASDVEVQNKVLSSSPEPPRRQVHGLPRDLESICLKSLEKDPGQRYQTARELADDLRRWLRDEPPSVARFKRWRHLGTWVRHNKGWTAAIGVLLLAFFTLLLGWGVFEKAEAESAHREALLHEETAQAARGEAQAARREALVLQLQQTRLAERRIGWSKVVLEQAWQAATIRIDDNVRNQAIAALAGTDARLEKEMPHGASALAWDGKGEKLLIGAPRKGKASLWKRGSDEEVPFETGGQGPVAFRADGTPVQLLAYPKDRWWAGLWDMRKRQCIRTFPIPPGGKAELPNARYPVLLSMTPDGTHVASATAEVDGKGNLVRGHLAAWEAGTGKVLVKSEAKATALALSPNGALLAIGDEDGEIRLWSLADGKELRPLSSGRTEISALAFGRNAHCSESGENGGPAARWLLASGGAGGIVTIWDLRTRQVKTRCHGSCWDIQTVAFSPDGMTLASAGHSASELWDTATGRLLLVGWGMDWATDIAFSPDGQRLAVCSDHHAPGQSHVKVYELESGRGMQSLRGLVGSIARVRFSRDGRWVAALSNNWEAAIWDTGNNRLLHVLNAPKGMFADNADLCFSPDGSRFAFVSGKQAKMWEVSSGRELGSWDLFLGLTDRLAFRSRDELVAFRMETASGRPPLGRVSRVCRIRHLTLPNRIKLLPEIMHFDSHVFSAAISPDGSHVVAAGLARAKDRSVRIYDGNTGKEVGTLPVNETGGPPFVRLDETGKMLSYGLIDGDQTALVDFPSGKMKGIIPSHWTLGPGANYWVGGLPADQPGWILVRRRDDRRLFTFGIDSSVSAGAFSAEGERLVWGHTDGSVVVCDIPAVQRRLAGIGLGW
jgi:serine/threonine protein kinase/WD40 repeat protein